jgi:hypothetical protein
VIEMASEWPVLPEQTSRYEGFLTLPSI